MSSGYLGRLIFTRKVTHLLKYHWPVPRNKSTKIFFICAVSVWDLLCGACIFSLFYVLVIYMITYDNCCYTAVRGT